MPSGKQPPEPKPMANTPAKTPTLEEPVRADEGKRDVYSGREFVTTQTKPQIELKKGRFVVIVATINLTRSTGKILHIKHVPQAQVSTIDAANTAAIRSHLKQIATKFANGDFSAPMFIHSQTPPGVPVMKQKRTAISYTFEELPAGGSVRIKTADKEALKAVHDFLRFQIDDHHTGDPLEVASR